MVGNIHGVQIFMDSVCFVYPCKIIELQLYKQVIRVGTLQNKPAKSSELPKP